MKTDTPAQNAQKKFDFSQAQPRPFLSNLPAGIDTYEEGVARFFRWRTGLDYYSTMDQIVDFVVNTGRVRVADMLTDTATFALRLAGRRAFAGRIHSFDSNVTLLERAKQRATHLNLQQTIEFKHFREPPLPLQDGCADLAVSFFELHRQSAPQYLAEALRILGRDGYLIVAELLEPKSRISSAMALWRKAHLRFIQKNQIEARAVYFDREQIIQLLFHAGFRQVIVQGLNVPATTHSGVFTLIAATK